ncbi:DUF2917 domain-containing protein [Hydrogenophaga sp. 5NK40-0174]|uniref:DUF2917 domain-containing protein n=1 Tax=Hydrogenophaga sp. 5NK40-0174 TaxID=3127649 RepID=UPI00310BC46B
MLSQFMHGQYQIDAISASKSITPTGWKVMPGHTIHLRPSMAGQLRVRHGVAWVTVSGRKLGQPLPSDQFLAAGDLLDVPAGASVVAEAMVVAGRGSEAMVFDWENKVARRTSPSGSRLQREVVTPARDFVGALGDAGMALMSLVAGVVGLVDWIWPDSGRSRHPLEMNQP